MSSRRVARLASLATRHTAWRRHVVRCQHEVATVDPHPYYLQAYRDQELSYWRQIARWMYADRRMPVRRSLDIGCAYGTLSLLSQSLFTCQVYCTDFVATYLSPSLVAKHGWHFAVNNIELDAFPWDTTFEVIILTEVLEHFNFHPVPTLTKIRSLLSERGHLYLSTPDAHEWGHLSQPYASLAAIPLPQQGMPVADTHVYQYTKEEFVEVVTAAGLRIERFGYAPGTTARHLNATLMRA